MDQALERLVIGGWLRRLDSGIYDTPRINRLTAKNVSDNIPAKVLKRIREEIDAEG